MKNLRALLLMFAVFALMTAGFIGCAAKQEVAQEGMATGSQGMTEAEQPPMKEAPGKVAEAPPGPKEQPEPVEAPRPELALGDVYFDFDSFEIKSSQVKTLQDNAAWLKDNMGTVVTVEGHCDERGTVEYNLALGERRSKAAKDYLVSLGVDASRIKIISYGKSKPFDPGHDESAWAKNRRAHFVIN